MKVTSFNFSFTHANRKTEASCDSFKAPHFPKYLMYRVDVANNKGSSDVYIFYDVPNERSRFTWYDLPGMKQNIARSIARGLEKSLPSKEKK